MDNKEKIAIITDSGTDVPPKYIEKYNMYVVPLIVNYNNQSYRDGIDININTICEKIKRRSTYNFSSFIWWHNGNFWKGTNRRI